MKTIVFHSYKGGVGRSLALANLALALSALDKKVVALDLDVDAPGLHSKFGLSADGMSGWESRVSGGYIDYLAYFFSPPPESEPSGDRSIVSHVPIGPTLEVRRDYLNKHFVIDISNTLKFIPAGKSDQKYWWNLASPWFNELFSISRNEYSPLGTIRLHSQRDFLREEKGVIEKLFPTGTDYFLVDCKSAREYSSVPLYYWANVIVSMFPANEEGIQGAARVHQFVRSVRQEEEDTVKIIAVACRVPGDFDYTNVKERYFRQLRDYLAQYVLDAEDHSTSATEEGIFLRLREHRLLEHSERLLTTGGPVAPADHWYHALKMDYVDLYAHIFNETDRAQHPTLRRELKLDNRADWMDALQMATHKLVDDGHIQIKPDHGIVENKDSQRNVLLRASTLCILVGNMAQAMPDDATREQALSTVGRNIGASFGAEFAGSEIFIKVDMPLEERLEIWCKYDSQNAGFGTLKPSFDNKKKEVVIKWDDYFLGELESGEQLMEPRFGFWLARGYINGVIEALTAPKLGVKGLKRLKSYDAQQNPMEFRFKII